jgi:effector-binding domain-containing protein
MSSRRVPGLHVVTVHGGLEEIMSGRETGTEATAPEPELVNLEPATTAVIRGVVPVASLRDFFDDSFRTLAHVLAAQRVNVLSPAFGLYHGTPGESLDLEVGFATDRPVQPGDGVVTSSLPGGRAGRLTHSGSFDGLGSSWQRLHSWIQAQGLSPRPQRWESYITRPSPEMNPRDLRTDLTWPLAG